ncbi:MAG: MFS transporter [Bacteroidia bacterium]
MACTSFVAPKANGNEVSPFCCHEHTKRSPLSTIFLTTFIDLLGVSIVIPVLPAVFLTPDNDFIAASAGWASPVMLFGLITAIFPLMQFFGAPLLGSLSDRYGRKPVLLISLAGALLGYLLFAYALYIQSLWLLFVSRAIPGFFGGNIAVVMSAISDISKPEDRPKNFGLVGMAFGLGFVLGPAIGGLLADDSILPWFSHTTPFLFTAFLTLANILLAWWAFPETLTEKQPDRRIRIFSGLENVAKAIRLSSVRAILSVVFLVTLGFAFFTQFYSVYLIEVFHFKEKDLGLLYGWIGLWIAITQGGLVRPFSKRFSSTLILKGSLLFMAIAIFVILIPKEAWWFYALNPLIAIGQGLSAPNLTTLVSGQAPASEQGQILGINQSVQSLGNIFPPVVAGYIHGLDERLPLLAAASFVFLGWLVYLLFFRKKR